jgi:hypothetical protein
MRTGLVWVRMEKIDEGECVLEIYGTDRAADGMRNLFRFCSHRPKVSET